MRPPFKRKFQQLEVVSTPSGILMIILGFDSRTGLYEVRFKDKPTLSGIYSLPEKHLTRVDHMYVGRELAK